MVKSITRRKVTKKNLKTRKQRRSAKANKLPKIKYIQLGGNGNCDQQIGEGGCGIAYKCMKGDEPIAVLKKVRMQADKTLNLNERILILEHEKNVLSELEAHDNIVEYITDDYMLKEGFDKIREPHYYMGFCDGGDLIEYLKTTGGEHFDHDSFFTQIFAGLRHLYKNHIIHSDIKEYNILVSTVGGKPIFKITDFGFAVDTNLLIPPVTKELIHRGGTIEYTPIYLQYTTYFRDLYAFFCILYFLVGGNSFNLNRKEMKGNARKISEDDLRALHDFNEIPEPIKEFHKSLLNLQTNLLKTYENGSNSIIDIDTDYLLYKDIYSVPGNPGANNALPPLPPLPPRNSGANNALPPLPPRNPGANNALPPLPPRNPGANNELPPLPPRNSDANNALPPLPHTSH